MYKQTLYTKSMEQAAEDYTAYQVLKSLTKAELKKIVKLSQNKEVPLYGELLRVNKDLKYAQAEINKEQPSSILLEPTNEPYDRERDKNITW